MAKETRRTGIWNFRLLILALLCLGYIGAESEKDFEFAEEKTSLSDDEDFLGDEAGSGDIEGSGATEQPPKVLGRPALYRVVLNITSLQYTAAMRAAGRDIGSLPETQQIQLALQRLFEILQGKVNIRIVDLQPGSLMVTFDVATDGSQTEEEIKKLLKSVLDSGSLNGLGVSPTGYDFKIIRDSYVCPPSVGHSPSALPSTGSNWANLMVNNAFACNGFITSWNYYRASSTGTAFIGVFRQTSDQEFQLVSSTEIPEASVGEHSFVLQTPVFVQKGDFIGVFHRRNSQGGVFAMTTSDDNVLAQSELFQNYYISMFENDIEPKVSFNINDFVNSEKSLTYAIQAEMSYLNVPAVTAPPARACGANEWTCRNGDCVPAEYRCDQQPDCYDGSDEENCPTARCGVAEVQCGNTGQCIPEDFVCNGVNDCGDNWDENNCRATVPDSVKIVSNKDGQSSDSFVVTFGSTSDGGSPVISYLIRWRKVYVQNYLRNNQYALESAASEFVDVNLQGFHDRYEITGLQADQHYEVEIYARNVKGTSQPEAFIFKTARAACAPGQFQCTDGGCIGLDLYCDGFPNCADASDEPSSCNKVQSCVEGQTACQQPDGSYICADESIGCVVICQETEFQCLDGKKCTSFLSLCDGRQDCDDNSDENNCECAVGEFSCANGRQCISGSRRCDNRQDCDDNSDEYNCPCQAGSFQCTNSQIQECVDQSLVCDGTPDCSDGSDEGPQCGCQPGQWQCRDGTCIPDRMYCDGVAQCEDGSDEASCTVTCRPDQFTCADGNCVRGDMKCDGVPQCEDGSDEDGCPCQAGMFRCNDGNCVEGNMYCDGVPQCEDGSDELNCPGCRRDQFTCADGNCVRGDMKCDGVPQCEDGSDEDGCPCQAGMFQCNDGNCVEGNMYCDGIPQCEDGSDELNCPQTSCPPGDFQCKTTSNLECIDERLKCDGYPDCSDSSDEQGCPGCRADQFTCVSDGRCLPLWTRCNGRIECTDRSDERNCPSASCREDQFRCGDGRCIDLSRRCDKRDDCRDRSDELACPCGQGEFQCVDGGCIDDRRRCDRRQDCNDGSDEENCPRTRTCSPGLKPCGTGHCLSESRWCDGRADCPDSSDEQNCSLNCTAGQMECIVDNKCIPVEQICNRVYDCSDRRDEMANCPRCDVDDEFECNSDKSCISLTGRCNGVKECSDGSDEMNCPTTTIVVGPKNLRIRAGAEAIFTCYAQGLPRGASLEWIRSNDKLPMQSAVEAGKLMIPVAKPMDSGTYICRVAGVSADYSDSATLEVVAIGPVRPDENRTCGRDEAVCQNGQCIRREYRCDGEKDCTDGSDEPPDCYTNLCEPNEFQCPSGQCVMKIWRCDGEDDCSDGYDEKNCRQALPDAPCGMDEFQCVSGDQCVPLAYQCDAEIDCLDRSDEIGCTPPIITVPPVAEIEVELGATFTIICEAVGVPTPLIVWRLNWGNIPTGNRVTVTSEEGRGQLTIADARYEDAGAYTCEAINNRGSIFAIPDALVIVRLVVIGVPGIRTTKVIMIGGSSHVNLNVEQNTVVVGSDGVCPEDIQVAVNGSNVYNECPFTKKQIKLFYVAGQMVDFEVARKIVLVQRRGDTLPEPFRDKVVIHVDGLPKDYPKEEVQIIREVTFDIPEVQRRVIELGGRSRNKYRPETQIINIGIRYNCTGKFKLIMENDKQVLICEENITETVHREKSGGTEHTQVILTGTSKGEQETEVYIVESKNVEPIKETFEQVVIQGKAEKPGIADVNVDIEVSRQSSSTVTSSVLEVIKTHGAARHVPDVKENVVVIGKENAGSISGNIFEIIGIGNATAKDGDKFVEIGSNFVCDKRLEVKLVGSKIVCKCEEKVTTFKYIGAVPTDLEILRETIVIEGHRGWSAYNDQDFVLIYMGGVPEYLKRGKETVVIVTGLTAERQDGTSARQEDIDINTQVVYQNKQQRQAVLIGLSRHCDEKLVTVTDNSKSFIKCEAVEETVNEDIVTSEQHKPEQNPDFVIGKTPDILENVDEVILKQNQDESLFDEELTYIKEIARGGDEPLFVIKGASKVGIDESKILLEPTSCTRSPMRIISEMNKLMIDCSTSREPLEVIYVGINPIDLFVNRRILDIAELPKLSAGEIMNNSVIVYVGETAGQKFEHQRGVEYFRNIGGKMENKDRKVFQFRGAADLGLNGFITVVEIGFTAECGGVLEPFEHSENTVVVCKNTNHIDIRKDHLEIYPEVSHQKEEIVKVSGHYPVKPNITKIIKISGHSPESSDTFDIFGVKETGKIQDKNEMEKVKQDRIDLVGVREKENTEVETELEVIRQDIIDLVGVREKEKNTKFKTGHEIVKQDRIDLVGIREKDNTEAETELEVIRQDIIDLVGVREKDKDKVETEPEIVQQNRIDVIGRNDTDIQFETGLEVSRQDIIDLVGVREKANTKVETEPEIVKQNRIDFVREKLNVEPKEIVPIYVTEINKDNIPMIDNVSVTTNREQDPAIDKIFLVRNSEYIELNKTHHSFEIGMRQICANGYKVRTDDGHLDLKCKTGESGIQIEYIGGNEINAVIKKVTRVEKLLKGEQKNDRVSVQLGGFVNLTSDIRNQFEIFTLQPGSVNATDSEDFHTVDAITEKISDNDMINVIEIGISRTCKGGSLDKYTDEDGEVVYCSRRADILPDEIYSGNNHISELGKVETNGKIFDGTIVNEIDVKKEDKLNPIFIDAKTEDGSAEQISRRGDLPLDYEDFGDRIEPGNSEVFTESPNLEADLSVNKPIINLGMEERSTISTVDIVTNVENVMPAKGGNKNQQRPIDSVVYINATSDSDNVNGNDSSWKNTGNKPRRGDVEIDEYETAFKDTHKDVRTGSVDTSTELPLFNTQNLAVTKTVNAEKNDRDIKMTTRRMDIELNKPVELEVGNDCKGKIETMQNDKSVIIKCTVGGETLELNLIGIGPVEKKESNTYYVVNDDPAVHASQTEHRYVTDFISEKTSFEANNGKTIYDFYYASRMRYMNESKVDDADVNRNVVFVNQNSGGSGLEGFNSTGKEKRGDIPPDDYPVKDQLGYVDIDDLKMIRSTTDNGNINIGQSSRRRHQRSVPTVHIGEDESTIYVEHTSNGNANLHKNRQPYVLLDKINGKFDDLSIAGFQQVLKAREEHNSARQPNRNQERTRRKGRLSLKGKGYKRIQSLNGKTKIVKLQQRKPKRKGHIAIKSLHGDSYSSVKARQRSTLNDEGIQSAGYRKRHGHFTKTKENDILVSRPAKLTQLDSSKLLMPRKHSGSSSSTFKSHSGRKLGSRTGSLKRSKNAKHKLQVNIGDHTLLDHRGTGFNELTHTVNLGKDLTTIPRGKGALNSIHYGTSVLKGAGQRGPCTPPFYNFGAVRRDECVRCFCFGHSVQCFSSDLHVSRIALANKMDFVQRELDQLTPVDPSYVNFKPNTREYQVLDMIRALPQGKYYWKLPQEFLGDRLTSYGGEIKYTIYYDIIGRRQKPTSGADVIISGNGITLYYKATTVPSPGVPTSISVPLMETSWETTEGTIRGDTPVSQYADRGDLMMVLENLDYVLVRAQYDSDQTTSRIGGVFMTTAVNYETNDGVAYLVEDCVCPTGYTGYSCQDCAAGFTRVQTGGYLGECIACNCHGHSNDCDPYTGACLNCQHNTEGDRCQLCQNGYFGDARQGTPTDCLPCPCPLTEPPNQFSRTCYKDTDGDVTCGNCPPGYEGRRCERCAEGYNGNPMTVGSRCEKNEVEDYCDRRGSSSLQPNPFTRRCQCKLNVQGNLCDSCKQNTFYLSSNYELGCIECFCMGVSKTCQSTSWNRAQVGTTFTTDEAGFSITDMNGNAVPNQRFSVDTSNRELVYRFNQATDDILYWSLPARFLGDKVTAYGGSLRFSTRYSSRQSAVVNTAEPLVKISGNDITLVHRTRQNIQANRANPFSIQMYEQNWIRIDGQPATREHLLMALADLDSIQIRASYEESQGDSGLRDVTLDIAEDRQTQQGRAYPVEQCVCPVGHRGLSCEDCDTGYTRSGGGLYLGLCELCRCNGHSNECDPETGVCRNCQHNTEGDSCERCAVGFYGDATRGTRSDCQKCPCPLTDSPNQFSPTCKLDRDAQVTCTACPAGHTGRKCETCISGYTGNPLKRGDYCRLDSGPDCDCDTRGTVANTQCDETSQQCQCKPYVQGLRCARCREGHFYLEADNPQGCLTCFCSGITNQCTSSSYYRESLRPQIGSDGTHNFVLMNRRMNNIISDGFTVDSARNQVTYSKFDGVQRDRESLFFQLPAKFRGDQVASYGGYLRFTLEFTAQPSGRMYRDVDIEIISQGQSLRLYHLFDPPLQEGKTQTYEILLRESSFSYLNSAPTRETFMTILSNIGGFLIRATYNQEMNSVTLRDVSMDTAIPTATALGGAPMVEDCRCPAGYTGLSCQRCAQGYLRVSDGRGGLGRCVKCNCNNHASACDPDTGRCLDCQHNTEGDRCERCASGYYGDSTSGTPNDCRACPCPLTIPSNQFSRTCQLDVDNLVTCDRCPTGYSGRNCETCAPGYVGNPSQVGDNCRPEREFPRPNVTVTPVRVDEPVGSTVVFKCSVSAQGTPNVVWSRLDSQPLPGRAYTSPTYDLRIQNLKREDSGRYVCTATNAYGVSRGVVELKVTVGGGPIQVRIDLPRVEVDEGRTVRLTCTAVGAIRGRTYILSWSKQGSLMPVKAIDQNGVLVIPNAQARDAGNYVCTGSDMFTVDEAVAVLIVNSGPEPAPTVKIEPRYQTVDQGSPVRFECIATGDPTPTIKWRRGGNRPLNPAATVTPDGVLTIPSAQLEDESDYYCEASNEAGTTEIRTILYVTRVEKPEITILVRKSAVFVDIGDTARLECYAEDGSGRITLFWSRSSGLPPGSTQSNGILTIPNVQPSYGGNYVCTGTDTITGSINTAITVLEVEVEPASEPPTASVEPEKITIPMGTTGTLRCIVTGKPEPKVTWLKSREELSSNHQVNGNVLRITQATMADRGIYVCRAENTAGADQDWAIVEVERRMKPKIDIYPNITQRVSVGGSALFQCRVMDGDPPPTITWSRVGGAPLASNIETMANGVIMFKQVTQAEQGGYICTATNDMGAITATATLLVAGPPTITLQPSKVVYAIVGQRVSLECTADGDPTPSVYWIQPDQPRRGDVLPETLAPYETGSAILDIARIDDKDAGYYTCVASNTGGRTEDTVQVIVRETQNVGVSISGPSTVSAVEGQDLELICTANAIQNPTIRWSRRQGVLPPGHSQRNGILSLPRFRSEYQGEYICTTRTTQDVYTASVFIIVTVAPRLTISPSRITARAGDTVQLRCTASGSGPFNIEWSKVQGQMNPRATERDGILEIRQVTAADSGQYKCVVDNNIGSSEGFAIVQVEVPPSVIISQRDVYAQPGRNAELRCDATGSPPPVIRWAKENGDLPVQHRIQNGVLTIYNVQPEDQGRYICTATSPGGSSRDYGVLYVRDDGTIGIPNGNVDTQVVNVGDRVSMECIVTGTPLPTITWSRDDGPLPKDAILGEGILIIPQAKIEDAGTYTCLAVNEAGSISSKVVLYVRAQPLVNAPSAASAALGGKVSLVCDASGYPSPDITWYRKDGDMPDDYTIVDGDLVISRVRPEDAGTYVCHAQNEYGTTDTPVALNVGPLVPYFDQNPQSYMAFGALKDAYNDFDLLVSLKPKSTEGMVLYNGQYEDGGGDFVCFGLKEGFPEFRFDVGSGPAVIRGDEKLDLDKWHTIKLKRTSKKGTMIVNEQPAYTGQSPGYFTGLDLQENMYLGGVPDYDKIPTVANFREGFVGSISEMKVSGINLDLGAEALEIVGVEPYNACSDRPCHNGGTCAPANQKQGFKCMCAQGFTGPLCDEIGERCYAGACGPDGRCYNLAGQTGYQCICPFGKTGMGCQADVMVINPFFNRTSFISYPPPDDSLFTLNLYTEFKPHSLRDGIILYEGNSKDGTGDFMALVMKDGYLEFRFDTGSGPAVVRSRNPIRVNEWVRVKVNRKNRDATLVVNEDLPVTGASSGSTIGLNLKLPLFLGGSDPTHPVASGVGAKSGFVGCVAELQVNERKIDLKSDALEFYNVVDCGERRLCERQPCKNKAVCEDLPGPDYRCLCGGSHTGKNCETEINICLTNSPCLNGAPCSMTGNGYRCDCLLGYAGNNCQLEIDLGTAMSFQGDSYIEFSKSLLPHRNTQDRQTVTFTVTTTQSDGILLWQGAPGGRPLRGGDHFAIGLKNGYVEYSYEMGSGPANIMSKSRVDDGVLHTISVERLGRTGTLTVDKEMSVEGQSQGFLQMLNADGNIFLGGVSLPEAMTDNKYSENFVGCIGNIVINGKGPLQPIDAIQGYNVEECQNN